MITAQEINYERTALEVLRADITAFTTNQEGILAIIRKLKPLLYNNF